MPFWAGSGPSPPTWSDLPIHGIDFSTGLICYCSIVLLFHSSVSIVYTVQSLFTQIVLRVEAQYAGHSKQRNNLQLHLVLV